MHDELNVLLVRETSRLSVPKVLIGNGPTPQSQTTDPAAIVATDTRVKSMPTSAKERAALRRGQRGSRP